MPIVMQCCGNMKEDKKKQGKKSDQIKCPKNRGIVCESMEPNPRLKIKTTLSPLSTKIKVAEVAGNLL